MKSGQGADEIFAGYSWYPPLASPDGVGDDAYAVEFLDRDRVEILLGKFDQRVAGLAWEKLV